MIKYINIFRLVRKCLLVARKENLIRVLAGLAAGRRISSRPAGRPDRPILKVGSTVTGKPTGRSTRPVTVDPTGFRLWFRRHAQTVFLVTHQININTEIESFVAFDIYYLRSDCCCWTILNQDDWWHWHVQNELKSYLIKVKSSYLK